MYKQNDFNFKHSISKHSCYFNDLAFYFLLKFFVLNYWARVAAYFVPSKRASNTGIVRIRFFDKLN